MLSFIALVCFTAFLFMAWYLLLSSHALKEESTLNRLIASVVLTCGQIVITQIILGHFGILSLRWVVFSNLGISGAVLGFLGMQPGDMKSRLLYPLVNFLRSIPRGWQRVKGWENRLMLIFSFILFLWIFSAAYLLPPRSFDDVYHLPPIFQYLQDGKISILPVNILSQFAYPQNAEFLFLWPLIFMHDARIVNIVQALLAIFGVLVLYNISVNLGTIPRVAFFVSLLFPFVPVVSGQAASSNIDLIAAVFFLVTLSFALNLWKRRHIGYFFISGVSLGMLLGMKYSFLIFNLFILPLIFYPVWKYFREKFLMYSLWYSVLIIIFGGYWYLRNIFVFHNPVWPFPF